MQARALSPIPVATFRWQPGPAAHACTLVCKATFDLVQGQARLSAAQDPIVMADEHYDDNPIASVYRPSDRIPFKPHVDVVLVGDAYAPNGEPVRSVVTELMVRGVHKVIEVFRDRHFNHGGDLIEGKRFVRMSLKWERARGGPLTSNPVGIDPEGERDRYGRLPLPNLQPSGLNITALSDRIEPMGYGPVGERWPWRLARLGRHAKTWNRSWTARPLPGDIDRSFFNCSPGDQRVDNISPSESISLNHLHPTHERLVCHLPGRQPVAFVERAGAARQIELRADTLWIDTSRRVLTVTWRGQIDLHHPDEDGLILVGFAEAGQQLTWAHLNAMARGESVSPAAPPPPRPSSPHHPPAAQPPLITPLPAAAVAALNAPPPTEEQVPIFATPPPPVPAAAPSNPASPSGPPSVVPPTGRPRGTSTTLSLDERVVRAARNAATAGLPFRTPTRTGQNNPDPVPPSFGTRDTGEIDETGGTLMSGPESNHTPPWLQQRMRKAHPHTAIGDEPTLIHDAPTSHDNRPPPPPALSLRDTQPEIQVLSAAARITSHDALPSARGMVELLWARTTAAAQVRANGSWTDLDDGEGKDERAVDRRLLIAVLQGASASDSTTLRQQMLRASQSLTGYVAPLALQSGQLTFAFDSAATLKATATALAPHAIGDDQLMPVLRNVKELMSAPWMQNSEDAASNLTAKLRTAATHVDALALDEEVRRALLRQRAYRRRELFGEPHIVAHLKPHNSSERIPCYLPAAQAASMPMFEQLSAHILAEAHLRQDQFESHDIALRVVALGRLVDLAAHRPG